MIGDHILCILSWYSTLLLHIYWFMYSRKDNAHTCCVLFLFKLLSWFLYNDHGAGVDAQVRCELMGVLILDFI